MEGLKEKGFISGENLEVTNHNALRSINAAHSISQEIGKGKFDLILTSGTQALQTVAKANQTNKTPHVFGLVANPFAAGVGLSAKDPMDHPSYLVGVGSFPPVREVFELVKEIHPGLQKVGVVWNPDESNSREGMEKARFVSAEMGIELLEAQAREVDEVGKTAADLVAKGAQILWIGADNTAHHAADSIIKAARAGGIPVMSSLPGDAKRGALLDLSQDWHEVGVSVGKIAGDILAGANPGKIPIQTHSGALKLILNQTALKGLNEPWSLPAGVVERADKVIK